jgi:S-adenosylmethionine:diacylglycerol 3-amino-3-carboxypropyl transferase
MSGRAADTVWKTGRFDARRGPGKLLFGRMHEDSSIELNAFHPGGRIFCIASAGCTAIALSRQHDVVAVDINPIQIAYATQRVSGGGSFRGQAERMMDFGRALAPAVGWTPSRIREFLDLADPAEQIGYWKRHLDTFRFRTAMDLALSRLVLGVAYARGFLLCLPANFGRVMRGRMERAFARHSNRENPHARALLLGALSDGSPLPDAGRIRLVSSDAATFLEREPPGSFDGFALSNVLDAAGKDYRQRLLTAVKRAAAPQAVAVLRSFSEPSHPSGTNVAADDRSMIWGTVEVKPALAL